MVPVQKVDGAQVTITSCSGITDIFGNEAVINGETVDGPKLESALPQDAITGVSAVYENRQATVTVNLSSETAYVMNYNSYHQPTDGSPKELPYRAVITDSDGTEVETAQIYVNEDDTFTTQPVTLHLRPPRKPTPSPSR